MCIWIAWGSFLKIQVLDQKILGPEILQFFLFFKILFIYLSIYFFIYLRENACVHRSRRRSKVCRSEESQADSASRVDPTWHADVGPQHGFEDLT